MSMVCADVCSDMHVCTYVLNNHERVYWQLMARQINFWKLLMLLRAYPPAYGRAVASAHVAHPVALSSQTIIIDDPADELTDRELFEQMLADKTADLWDDVCASAHHMSVTRSLVSDSFMQLQNVSEQFLYSFRQFHAVSECLIPLFHIVSENIVQFHTVS